MFHLLWTPWRDAFRCEPSIDLPRQTSTFIDCLLFAYGHHVYRIRRSCFCFSWPLLPLRFWQGVGSCAVLNATTRVFNAKRFGCVEDELSELLLVFAFLVVCVVASLLRVVLCFQEINGTIYRERYTSRALFLPLQSRFESNKWSKERMIAFRILFSQ